MTGRGSRVVRGTLAASIATFAALFSHVIAGGAMPGWLGILAPWVLSAMVCTVLAGRRLSAIRLTLAVAASQILFHTLFVLGATGTNASIAPYAHHAHGVAEATALSAATGSALHADATMWVWHALAAGITAAALYRGERTAVRLRELATTATRWIRRRLDAPIAPEPASLPRIHPAGEQRHAPTRPQLSPLLRRGPPRLVVL